MGAAMIIMMCTTARGGMRSVVDGYRDGGFFEKWGVSLIDTHVEGGYISRFRVFCFALFRFVGLLARREVDGLHCHVAAYGSFWRKSIFASLAHLSKVPVILHLHGSRTKEFIAQQPGWRLGMIRWQLRKANAVIVLSGSWKDYILSIEPSARVRVIPNGVTLPQEYPSDTTGNKCVNILFLGEIGERKGVYDLLRALQGVLRECTNVRLQIGGKGEIERAQALVRELGIEHAVEFRGWVIGDEKKALLGGAGIYVLPSYNEGLPMSILEAMSWKLPIVSTTVGGIPELVRDGEEGFLISPGDIAALTTGLVKLTSNASLRQSMGQKALIRVEQGFSSRYVSESIDDLYLAIFKCRGGVSL